MGGNQSKKELKKEETQISTDYQYINLLPEQQKLLQKLAQEKPSKREVTNILIQIYQQNKKKVITLQNLLSALTELPGKIRDTFLQQTIPIMAKQTLIILQQKLKISLMINQQHIQLSKKFIFQFLSMQFFHLCQNQDFQDNQFPNGSYLSIIEDTQSLVAKEKLKCHIQYFNEAAQAQSDDFVSFHRISFNQKFHSKFFQSNIENLGKESWKYWTKSQAELQDIKFTVQPIESFDKSIILDFANKYLGGGVLGRGCVQEEILLSLMPEAMAAIFFTSKLEDQDAFYIGNATTYSGYSGYGEGFKFIQQDPINRKQMILAMDAESYFYFFEQFNSKHILREINKAFISFSQGQEVKDDFSNNLNTKEQNIITGKWGCGVFGGNVELKMLIQLIAFSQTKTYFKENFNLYFSTFQNENEADFLKTQLEKINLKFKTVGSLSTALTKLGNLKEQGFKVNQDNLIDYLLKH